VVSFFAVELGFAVKPTPAAAAAEFAQLVQGLHANGIEVIIQVLHMSFAT
jgi:pullulanase/glycogen debranching enzyme